MVSNFFGIDFQARINYSNRFAFIQIYDGFRGHEFEFDFSIAEQLEFATSPSEIDSIIKRNYLGKRGKHC